MTQRKQSTLQVVFNGKDVELHKKLKATCALNGTTMQAYLLELIRKDLKDK